MQEFQLNDKSGDATVVHLGQVRIVAHLVEGKEVLTISSLRNGDVLHMFPSSSNQVIIKSDKIKNI